MVGQKNLHCITVTKQLESLSKEGLCLNCVNRETCNLPKARNEVLYCNEYE